jgi:hypothetical protein
MYLILIGAHPRIIEKGELTTKHFWGNEIQELIQREKIDDPIIHTIDLLPGGTYQQNIFDEDFVKDHLETYAQIYLIDCGGIWYVLQSLDISDSFARTYNSPEIREMRERLRQLTHEELNNIIKDLIEKLYSMLEYNGICVFSKFTNSMFQETFVNMLNELGYIYEIEQRIYVGTVIIIRKYNDIL